MRTSTLVLSIVVVALSAGSAFAEDFTWADANSYLGGAWEPGANWLGDPNAPPPTGPNALDANAILPQPNPAAGDISDRAAVPVTVTVDGAKLLQSLTFDGPSSTNKRAIAYTVDAATDAATDTLTFADGGHITHAEFHTWNPVSQRINNNIIMQGDLTINENWDSANVSYLRIYGTITGSGTLTLDASYKPDGGSATGRLELRGNSSATFTGDVVINGGHVSLFAGSLGDTVGITTLNRGSLMGATSENVTVTGILGTARCAYESYGGDRVYDGNTTLVGGATIELNPGGNQLTTGSNVKGTAIVGEGNVLVKGYRSGTNPLSLGRIDIEGVNTYTGKLTIDDHDTNRNNNWGPRLRLQGELPNSNIEILNGSTLHGDTTGGITPTIHFSDGDIILVSGYPEILNDPDPPTPAINSIFDTEFIKWDLTGLTASPGSTVTLVNYASAGEFVLGDTLLLEDVLTAESTAAGWTLSIDLMDLLVKGELSGSIPGDADENGVVDASDYIVLKTNIGQASGATTADGDFDEDGDVDWHDLQLLQAHYGETNEGAGAVPEPATLGLLAIGAMALIRRRRRS